MNAFAWIAPLGIAAYVLLALTVATGLLQRRVRRWKLFPLHRALGVSALVVATMHAFLVLWGYLL